LGRRGIRDGRDRAELSEDSNRAGDDWNWDEKGRAQGHREYFAHAPIAPMEGNIAVLDERQPPSAPRPYPATMEN